MPTLLEFFLYLLDTELNSKLSKIDVNNTEFSKSIKLFISILDKHASTKPKYTAQTLGSKHLEMAEILIHFSLMLQRT